MAIGPYWVGDVPATDLQIAITRNGETADLSAFTSVTIVVLAPDRTVVSPAPTATINGGSLLVNWPQETVFAAPGVYTIVPTLEGPDGIQEVVDPQAFIVNPTPAEASWLSPAEVFQITRVMVTDAEIASASAILSLITGRDLSTTEAFIVSDIRNLKYAMAWQSAHIKANPKIMTDLAANSKAVGDVSVSYDNSGGAQWLHPLTRIALKKVSWRGNRTVLVGRLPNKVYHDPLLEATDPVTGWVPTPMGG